MFHVQLFLNQYFNSVFTCFSGTQIREILEIREFSLIMLLDFDFVN